MELIGQYEVSHLVLILRGLATGLFSTFFVFDLFKN